MSSSPKISIIVPIYKAENYLCRCLDSIQQQTFCDWECILINDGSPDNSGAICDEYANIDGRFHVIHKENGGVSAARQTGLDYCNGEYVIHVDPDDWIEVSMLKELYSKAKELDVDMVICDYYEDIHNQQKYIKQEPSCLDNEQIFKEMFQQLHSSCWNKLVKRACYSEYGIHFPQGFTFMEDLFVSALLCLAPIKISYISKAYYHYVIDENVNSLSRKPTKQTVASIISLINYFEDIWASKQMNETIFNYKYYAKDFAYRSNAYSQREIRVMYEEINSNLFLISIKNIFSKPWMFELYVAMYLPHIIGKSFCSLMLRLTSLKKKYGNSVTKD